VSSLALDLALTLISVTVAVVRDVAAIAPLRTAWSSWPVLAVGAVVLWTAGTWLVLTLAVAALYAWLALALVRAARHPPAAPGGRRRRPIVESAGEGAVEPSI
jgi:hypothetical protein